MPCMVAHGCLPLAATVKPKEAKRRFLTAGTDKPVYGQVVRDIIANDFSYANTSGTHRNFSQNLKNYLCLFFLHNKWSSPALTLHCTLRSRIMLQASI